MSKRRQELDTSITETDLAIAEEGDLTGYVVFTQLKAGGPFIYAGWLDAPDPQMALLLACEHYGQDQKCTCIRVAPREFVGGLRENAGGALEPVSQPREYQMFTQKNAGDQHVSSIAMCASSAAEAIELAQQEIESAGSLHNIWAIPVIEISSTDENDMIWRHTDQSYRLARGYSKDVREKWEKLRAERDLVEYEKDDLHDTF